MNNLEFNKIITTEEFNTVSESDKNKLISLANIELNRYKSKNFLYPTFANEKIKAREIIENGLLNDFNSIEKEIMITSIAYDTNQIINLLINSNIKYIHLEGLCNNLTSMKKAYITNPNGKLLENGRVKKILSILDKICFMINFSIGTQDQYLIINKLMYIAVFEKELYLKLEQQKTKKI